TILACLINLILFSIVSVFCYPIYNSGDDAYLSYLSGGGFGQAPTELLHYHYGLHPYIGLLLKKLAVWMPGINWYSALLYIFHFTAATVILTQLLKRNSLRIALAWYALLFCTTEVLFLLQPTFTNAALVTAIAGSILVYRSIHLSGWLLIILAAMLRLHMLIPALFIATPFFLSIITRKNMLRLLIDAAAVAMLITAFLSLQERYYQKYIPGWQQEEQYRQTIIGHVNTPRRSPAYLPQQQRFTAELLQNGNYWDKQLLSPAVINHLTATMKLQGAWQQEDFKGRVYWLLVDNRLLFLALAFLLWWRFPLLPRRERLATISAVLAFILFTSLLLLFFKLPGYIVPAGVLELAAFAGILPAAQSNTSRLRKWLLMVAGALILSWAMVRIYKLNRWNIQHNKQWKCAYQLISSDSSKLFVVADDRFPLDYFHVWNVPAQFKLPNLLYKDHFLNNTHGPIFQRFGIRSTREMADKENVFFTGEQSESVLRFFGSGTNNVLYAPTTGRDCIQRWQIKSLFR
ncbi:MAG TPA: hypothetical protein VD996_03920, partial [Chitinophagaceae bacterium]|nr:hypothetical protein [Chitinophagaceae bacterium]